VRSSIESITSVIPVLPVRLNSLSRELISLESLFVDIICSFKRFGVSLWRCCEE